MKINRPPWEPHGPTGSLQGQDTFVSLLLPHRTFVDVGAGHGIFKSNTWNLERMGWRGLLFDRNPEAVENCQSNRLSPAFCVDVTTFDFTECFRNHKLPKVIDYISFDVDRATAKAVMNFPFERYEFLVMTIEHDLFYRGSQAKEAVTARMKNFPQYRLAAENVCAGEGKPMEDWFIHRNYFLEDLLPEGLTDEPWWAVIRTLSEARASATVKTAD